MIIASARAIEVGNIGSQYRLDFLIEVTDIARARLASKQTEVALAIFIKGPMAGGANESSGRDNCKIRRQ